MRILVIGAGGAGGYFGGRLLEAGQDVTFLVRPKRAARLAETGLIVRSPLGDIQRPAPIVTADALRGPFDLILLSCKAYDLEDAMESFALAIGPKSTILPLLNGIGHLDRLEARFGSGAVLGGQCVISAVLDPEGRILHLNEAHSLTFGERDGTRSARAETIAAAFSSAKFDARLSETILQEMWEKFVFIAALAGITCLMRASVGEIKAAGGADLAGILLDECAAIAAHEGFPPREAAMQRSRTILTASGSPLTASMLRDIEQGGRIESDAIIGDLLRRAGNPEEARLLRVAHMHLKAYEARRARKD